MDDIFVSENEIEAKVETIAAQHQNHTLHMYIDITGDLVCGTLLSQIMYWFSNGKNGKTKLRVFKDGHFWLAKQRGDWYDEVRITKRQYDHAIKELKKRNLVILAKYKFDSLPTIHIRPNYDIINDEIKKWKNIVRNGVINNDVNFALREEYECKLIRTPKNKDEENERDEQIGNNEKRKSQRNNEKCKTGITKPVTLLTVTTNNDYSITGNTDINAFNSNELKDNINAFRDGRKDEVEKIPYIDPDNCTQQELLQHIRCRAKKFLDKHGESTHAIVDELSKIIEYFYQKYRDVFGKSYNILSDKAFENVVVKFLYPSELLAENEIYYFDAYKKMIDRYFQTDFGKNSGYSHVELSLPHFMSDTIRENMAMNTLPLDNMGSAWSS